MQTSAKAGDYFDNGSIAHLSHVIEDLFAFYASPEQEPNPADPSDAGGPFRERVQYMFRSNQVVSNEAFATPGQNVPAGSNQFMLEFISFQATAQLFASMRQAMAAQKMQSEFGGAPGDNGLERCPTAAGVM